MNKTKTGLRRSHFEIIAKILSFTRTGKRKTSIMYNCNLSFDRAAKTIRILAMAGLLAESDVLYFTTEKGKEYIQKYSELENLLEFENLNPANPKDKLILF